MIRSARILEGRIATDVTVARWGERPSGSLGSPALACWRSNRSAPTLTKCRESIVTESRAADNRVKSASGSGRRENILQMKKLIFVLGGSLIAGAALAQLTIVDDIAGTFVDISGTGTNLLLSDDSSATITSTVGNAVFAAGSIRVGNNGAMGFGIATGELGFTNAAIPGTGTPGGMYAAQALAPYWDDIDSETGGVFWQEIGGVLYVQWENRSHFPGPTTSGTLTMQVQVFSAGPVYAQFLYENVEGPAWGGGASATIGYLDGASGANSGNNIQWSFDTPASVANGTVLSIAVPEPGSFIAIAAGLGLLLIRRKRK